MTERERLSPVPGEPNPELGKIGGPQKAMLLMIAVGFIVLIGLIAYLPDVATTFK
ncbi:cell division protein FtsL [Nitrobacter vulgaris]|nr:cell division protein FtsL [Nitrobacter vulgaris]